LSFKIILEEIYFKDINWIDAKKIEGTTPKMRPYTHLQMIINLKNGNFKKYMFLGKENEFYDIIYNWKNIAGYK
jgi:hypothetical protein